MTRTITALHTLQNGETVTALGNLPGPDDFMSHDDLLRLANQAQSAAFDNRRIAHAPLRHPVTPGYLEYPEPPAYGETCNFEPVGIDSEGGSHD